MPKTIVVTGTATGMGRATINKFAAEGWNVVATVRKLCRDNPTDWKKTRLAMKERWQKHGGIVRERNGYQLNTGCVVAALIYGRKDFVETLRTAFNLGWDADCDAATAATIVGVLKGRRWMNDQHWDIKDIYRNTTRDDMPNDETLTGHTFRLIPEKPITTRFVRYAIQSDRNFCATEIEVLDSIDLKPFDLRIALP